MNSVILLLLPSVVVNCMEYIPFFSFLINSSGLHSVLNSSIPVMSFTIISCPSSVSGSLFMHTVLSVVSGLFSSKGILSLPNLSNELTAQYRLLQSLVLYAKILE